MQNWAGRKVMFRDTPSPPPTKKVYLDILLDLGVLSHINLIFGEIMRECRENGMLYSIHLNVRATIASALECAGRSPATEGRREGKREAAESALPGASSQRCMVGALWWLENLLVKPSFLVLHYYF